MGDQFIEDHGIKDHSFSNWAKTFSCSPERYFEPKNKEEVLQILSLARAKKKLVRVSGRGHSPSDLACTDDYMINLKYMDRVLEVNKDTGVVEVEGGITLQKLNEELDRNGLALSVAGSVSDITLAGAISTGTHGTGANFTNLCSYVNEIEMALASGEIKRLSEKDGDIFRAACLSLGCFGIILSLRIQCEPAFNMLCTSYPAKFKDVLETLNTHIDASDHFRFTVFPYTEHVYVYHCKRTDQPLQLKSSWFRDYLIGYYLLEFCYWLGTFFPNWIGTINSVFRRLCYTQHRRAVQQSYKAFNFECLFQQYVTEWFIPVSAVGPVLVEINAWIEKNKIVAHFPQEVRFVKEDDIMISPAKGRFTCAINPVIYRPYGKKVAYEEYFTKFSDICKKYDGRPHWAKEFDLSTEELEKMYPEWNKFQEIRSQFDPNGTFLNTNLKRFF